MKAISLHQPWASLIAVGVKTVETRTWKPPVGLVGQRIAIHASKGHGDGMAFTPEEWTAVMELCGDRWPNPMPRGCVVATARLADVGQVRQTTPRTIIMDNKEYVECWFNHGWEGVEADPYGDFSVGRWLWFLEDVEPVTPPVPEKGRQGFWEWRR